MRFGKLTCICVSLSLYFSKKKLKALVKVTLIYGHDYDHLKTHAYVVHISSKINNCFVKTLNKSWRSDIMRPV